MSKWYIYSFKFSVVKIRIKKIGKKINLPEENPVKESELLGNILRHWYNWMQRQVQEQ